MQAYNCGHGPKPLAGKFAKRRREISRIPSVNCLD